MEKPPPLSGCFGRNRGLAPATAQTSVLVRVREERRVLKRNIACVIVALSSSLPLAASADDTGQLVCSNKYGQAELVILDYDAQTATLVDGSTPDGSVVVQSAPAKIDDNFIRFQGAGMAGDAPTTYTIDLGAKTLSIREWAIGRDGPKWSTDVYKCGDWTATGEKP